MHGPINVKSPNNTSKWQMAFNSPFKGLMNLEFSRRIFKKFSNIKLHEIQSSGIRVIPKRVSERNGHDKGGFS